ncbi:hypothetical protein HY571_02055 [Candidatus Micrarchaeota archaeon]|nr:hypothetical protein [Candidatus Micrarchaeota archaeon]
MKGQITLEFMVITAGLLAIYAALSPLFFSSFQDSLLGFNAVAVDSISEQIKWKAEQVELLDEGAILIYRFSSPVEFATAVKNQELFIEKGKNELVFEKTDQGVEVYSK